MEKLDVVVPFASVLAEEANNKAVRLRRDFQAMLGLVQGHALLHQRNRQRDAKGRVVAAPDDYEVVHELIAEMISEATGDTVPAVVRQTVDVVFKIHFPSDSIGTDPVTVARVAKHWGFHARRRPAASGAQSGSDMSPRPTAAQAPRILVLGSRCRRTWLCCLPHRFCRSCAGVHARRSANGGSQSGQSVRDRVVFFGGGTP